MSRKYTQVCISQNVIFDLIKRIFGEQIDIHEFEAFKKQYMDERSIILNKTLKRSVTGKIISDSERQNLIERTVKIENSFFDYIENLANI